MTQIVVTLDHNADENFLRRMIENMKGVVKATLTHSKANEDKEKENELIDSLDSIKKSFKSNPIDLSDPKTQYILSK